MFSIFRSRGVVQFVMLCTCFVTLVILTKSSLDQAASLNLQGEPDAYTVNLPVVMNDYIAFTAEYQMPPLSQNPLLMRAIRSDGYTVDYFGSRTEAGVPSSLDSISVLKEGDDTPVSITMENERPREIIADNGSKFIITWIDDTNIRITATTSNGKYQVSLPVNLEDPFSTSSPAKVDDASLIEREPCEDGVNKGTITTTPNFEDIESPSVATDTGFATISLTRCGQAANADNPVLVRYESEELGTANFLATQIGSGIYQAEIPVYEPDNDSPIGDICSSVVNMFGLTCTAMTGWTTAQVTYVCGAIAAGIDLVAGGPTGEGVAILAGCIKGLTAAIIYCETLGAEPVPGAPSIDDLICEAIINLEQPSGTITLQPQVFDPEQGPLGGWVEGSKLSFPSTGPFSSILTLDLTGEPSIEEFYTVAEDPAPEEGYTAFATVFPCSGLEPTEVTISIVGTDGYSDSITYSITERSTLTLFIPGAIQGIRDVITVTVNGEVYRIISIVF